MNFTIIFAILILIFFLLIWVINSGIKQSRDDWKTLQDLQAKANLLNDQSTQKELIDFDTEFLIVAKKISNSLITPKLYEINGYIKGLYKKYN